MVAPGAIAAASEPVLLAETAAASVETDLEPRPLVSTDRYAKFEQRARRRRVDRRIEAARQAIERRRLKQAAAALDEVIELDPNLPELSELTAQFDELRRSTAVSHRGRWVVAATVFGATVFGASWLQRSAPLFSRPESSTARASQPSRPLVPAPAGSSAVPSASPLAAATSDSTAAVSSTSPAAAASGTFGSPSSGSQTAADSSLPTASTAPLAARTVAADATLPSALRPVTATADAAAAVHADPIGTAGASSSLAPAPAADSAAAHKPATPPVALASAVASPATQAARPPVTNAARQPEIIDALAPVAAAVPPPAPTQLPTAVAPRPQESVVAAAVNIPVPPKLDDADDRVLVREALQRYRSAYEGLDARSAHAVWPAVNQVALARAFEGLESQTLTFDACDVRVRGEAATAICQGSARYVPKVGNRQPRVESHTWNFSLHKAGADWKIDSARAER
jgi:hypothetical protein